MDEERPMCAAVSQPGTWLTVWTPAGPWFTMATARRNFICTQDDRDHPGQHSACDGQGHILAKWPRVAQERHGHGAAHPEWS